MNALEKQNSVVLSLVANQEVTGPDSLVSYSRPIPVCGDCLEQNREEMLLLSQSEDILAMKAKTFGNANLAIAKEAVKKAGASNNTKDSAAGVRVQKILNAVLPPRKFKTSQEGDSTLANEWVQFPSTCIAGREEVITLQEKLDQKLDELQGQKKGLCCVREKLFSQCFDEILRQVTLSSPEQGLLLLRLRDELRMTISAYRTIAHDSGNFGIAKAVKSEEDLKEQELMIRSLESQIDDRRKVLLDLKMKKNEMEKKVRQARDKRRKNQMEVCKKIKDQNKSLGEFFRSYKDSFSGVADTPS